MPADFTISLEWQPRDQWVGHYWTVRNGRVHHWICLVPCFPLHLSYLIRST